MFSKNYLEDKHFKESKIPNINQGLIFNENLNNLSKLLNLTFTYIAENIENFSQDNNENLKAAEIFSDNQINNDKYIIAEGNVLIIYKKMILSSDKLEYNREKRLIRIEGNINFKSNDQFIQASDIEYDLENKKGFINNAYGRFNFETLNNIASEDNLEININKFKNLDKSIRNVILEDSSANGKREFSIGDEENSSFDKGSPQKLETDNNKMRNWRFSSERIEINNDLWSAKKLFLTNDPFNKPQLIINNRKISAYDEKGEVFIKSKWSTLELDNFLKIPTGPKTYSSKEENELRWSIGYDDNSKDGLFITRNADTIFINKEKTKLDLKKIFFLQRALSGKTKTFSKKNDSVLEKKVEQDSKLSDLFGLEAEINSQFFDFDFYSKVDLNSLDFEKFKKIISLDSEISKVIYKDKKEKMQKETSLSFFGKYREKVWNGSLGEIEILSSYGTKIEKENNWKDNNVNKSSKIGLGYGNYESGKFDDSTQAINRKRLNLSLEREHIYPIWEKKITQQFITNKNKYSNYIISPGIKFLVKAKGDFYRYDDNNFQNLYTISGGPEFTLGNFKKDILDYTKLKILPKTTIASGQSPFKFDQANDRHGVEFSLEQQIIGPITFKVSTEYNLDINSKKYKEFHSNQFKIAWNRRAYNLSIFYNEDKKTGGINFKINNFSFDGIGKSFK